MKAPVGFILNPLSHTVQRKGSVLEAARDGIENTHLIRINDFQKLEEDVARLAQANPAAVFIEGGDGTLQAVMSAWPGLAEGLEGLPDFAILPGGSTNLASKIAGLGARTPGQIAGYISSYRAGGPVKRTSLRALKLDREGLERPLIGMLLSTGSLARAMIYTQNQIHGDGQRGSLAVAEAAARFAIVPETYLDTDGAPILRSSDLGADSSSFQLQGAHALSLMTTLPRLSLGLKPFWGQGTGAISFTHAAWPIAGFRQALLKVAAGMTGSGMKKHGLTSYKADYIEITCHDAIVLDGELLKMPAGARLAICPTHPIRFLR